MINLRPYQIEAIDKITQKFKESQRQFVVMPTGSGKTITFLSYARKNHKRILIVVPTKELLKQVYETSFLFYHKSEISRKGAGFYETPSKVHICIIKSISSDYLDLLLKKEFDLIIIDEAHHSYSKSYQRLINKSEVSTKILGVTATPDRLDGKMLVDIFQSCSFQVDTMELIEHGYLSDIEGFSVKTKIDLSDIHDHNGDFSLKHLFKKLCTHSRNQLIVDLLKLHMTERKTLIFCINIEHSKQVCKLLNENGVSSSHIDGTMTDSTRHSILSSFRNGEISCLCNCQLLTEGFDEPSIDGIILARPTRSRALFNQMIGRGLRTFKGKNNCKIIDVVDNHKNLAGFNHLITEGFFPEPDTFKSIRDIQDNVAKETLKVTEFSIERSNFFNESLFCDLEATDSMQQYLKDNDIYFQHPISFDEASFLIWFNELKKDYKNGSN